MQEDRIRPHPTPARTGNDAACRGLSRRGFLRRTTVTAVSGSVLGGLAAHPAPPAAAHEVDATPQVDIHATPPTVETRNGMPYREFGRTGEKVSILGIGGYHIGIQPSAAESVRVVRAAIDEGVNFMDNAWEYNRGLSEVRMGLALQDGYRDRVFLMTKVCGRTAAEATKNLEDSLRRLRTDVIDLWQFHECNYDNDPDWIFAPDGAIHTAMRARAQGKIRYIGFTGHKSPHIHLKMLAREFAWDAVQMPLNVCDAHYRSFAHQVLPVAIERGIAVIGMKSQGGDGSIPRKTSATVEDCLRYCFSLNLPVCLSGVTSVEEVRENTRIAKNFKPLGEGERVDLLARVAEISGDGRLERFKSTQAFDSSVHREQHGLG